jgi:hypothetical protein
MAAAAAWSVTATCAVWLSDPDVPVNVIVEFPGVADEEAVTVKLAAAPPAVICALDGETVIPDGMPEACTEAAPVNPLLPVTLTLTDPDPAEGSVSVDAETVRLKSGLGPLPPPPPPPFSGVELPPQPERTHARINPAASGRYLPAHREDSNSAAVTTVERNEDK